MTDWKTYLRWHLMRATAPMLNSAFVNESFHFNGTVMTGAKELRPRWKRALGSVNEGLGEALGILYVKNYFSPVAKARALEMVNNLKEAFRDRIESRQWMTDGTRVKALGEARCVQPSRSGIRKNGAAMPDLRWIVGPMC